jgi:signal transduction histidine kinase
VLTSGTAPSRLYRGVVHSGFRFRWLQARPLVADALITLFCAAVAVGDLFSKPSAQYASIPYRHADLGGVLLVLLANVPLILRRRYPLPVLLVINAALTVTVVVPYRNDLAGLGALVAVYTVAAYRDVRETLAAVAVSLTLGYLSSLWWGPTRTVGNFLVLTAVVAALVIAGRNLHTRRAYLAALEDRATAAEAERERAARQAVMEERRRIARELHDVVAHNISVMGVLADGARRALARNPGAADGALETIADTGRATLREMRVLLGALRTDEEPESAPVEPQPVLSAARELIGQVREAGLPVEVEIVGESRPLSPGVDLAAYRIIQEALTNTLKHARASTARVRLAYRDHELEVQVEDDGRGPAVEQANDGHGLLGMRERVGLYGGTLHVGIRPGGGYLVRARIPIEVTEQGSVVSRVDS